MDIKKEQRIVFNISGSELINKHKDNKNIPRLRVGGGESAVFKIHFWVGGVRVGPDSDGGGFGWRRRIRVGAGVGVADSGRADFSGGKAASGSACRNSFGAEANNRDKVRRLVSNEKAYYLYRH